MCGRATGAVGRLRTPLAAGLAIGVLGWGELVHWRASHRALGASPVSGGSQAVLVLGHRNRGDRANAVNRWRAGVGLRSLDPGATRRRVVVCGGAVAGPRSEAAVIADQLRRLAAADRRLAPPPFELLLEDRSRSTWQNVLNAGPMLAGFDRIVIASDSLHAEKARRYLHRLHPELAARLVRGRDHRWGELVLLKPLNAVRGLLALRRARRDLARMDRGARP